jgi:Ca2+-binding RTX toxin-like protein
MIRLLTSIAAALILAAPASAAVVEHTAGSGPANEEFIVYKAGKHERNRLTVTNARHRIVFADPGAKMRRQKGDYGGCKFTHGRHRATCKVDPRTDLVVRLGDRDDTLRFKGGNAGKLGPTARTDAGDAANFADQYIDFEGANLEHALIVGGPGDDVLHGTDGHDTMYGGPGADTVDAGAGNDKIVDTPDGAADRLLGGRGIDTVDADTDAPVTLDLQQNTLVAGGETDTLDSFEKARGGAGADKLIGSDEGDGLFGEGGDDTIDGRGGNDYLSGDLNDGVSFGDTAGVDTITGGSGDDVLDAREADNSDGEVLTPTDQLTCGDGTGDRIVARTDDFLTDSSCESSAFGVFNGDLFGNQDVNLATLSPVKPVSQGSDRAPTYAISCPGDRDVDCVGRVKLSLPPEPGMQRQPENTLGEGSFNIPAGTQGNVTVRLNDAGVVTLARAGQRVSVLVVSGPEAQEGLVAQAARFGWQQVLGP